MASFGPMTILDPEGPPSSGGVFYLSRPSPRDASQFIDGNWTVQVRAGGLGVVARGGDATCYEDARLQAFSMAQRGLDLLSILGVADRTVTEAENEHIVWWIEAGVVVLRIHENHYLGFQVSGTGTATDPSGRPIPSPPRNHAWHESYRYFRLSQATDDVYDAYRNLFLALESLLSTIVPVRLKPNGKPDEGEGAWLKRAIRTAGNRVDLSRFVPTGTTNPEEYLFKDLYEDKRTALFHAKKNRAVFLPHGAATERNSVTTSLVRLADLYLTMADAHLDVRRSRSSLSQAVYERMAHVIDGLTVTDATGDLFEQDKFIEGRRLVPLPCRWATELDDSDTRRPSKN